MIDYLDSLCLQNINMSSLIEILDMIVLRLDINTTGLAKRYKTEVLKIVNQLTVVIESMKTVNKAIDSDCLAMLKLLAD